MNDKSHKNKKNSVVPSAAALLKWYDKHARVLPWRAPPGCRADPYHVWLSEIMLQQTGVTTVAPYFLKFLRRWPTLADLAAAELDEVFQMWAGLGYYRRARGLHACAQAVQAGYGGRFPSEEKELLALPGIGPYTAAAISAIAFNRSATVVDGNVERVMARFHCVTTPLPKAKAELKALAALSVPADRAGDYAQALMDLGATICTPRSPKCDLCPWREGCLGRAKGVAQDLPARTKGKAKPKRYATAFVVWDSKGRVLLRQRPAEGLLASMMEVPSSPWQEGKELAWPSVRRYAPLKARWSPLAVSVHHVFTHFELNLRIVVASGKGRVEGARWVAPSDWDQEALPSVMRKILAVAVKEKELGEE
ncbi:MAG: A/G-specific adenine glycosylase [Bdellovibrionales bacterium]